MKIRYRYKGRLFDDVREVTENERMTPDFDYIWNEYIPFQVFLTGKTLYEGLTVESDYVHESHSQASGRGVEDLLREIGKSFEGRAMTIAAVSGGLDSSTVALALEPRLIYTGYYAEPGFDETLYAAEVAERLDAGHLEILLTERDFMENLHEMPGIFGVPIGGMGSIMEYVALKRALELCFGKVERVLFGNGGDEVFLGYFFNQLVMSFCRHSEEPLEWMANFRPQLGSVTPKIVDEMIIASIDRGRMGREDPEAVRFLRSLLRESADPVEKLLHVNIGCTLPSLIHLNQQMCTALGVEGVNPLAEETFLEQASFFNRSWRSTDAPKDLLRKTKLPLPDSIRDSREKRGFPIPFHHWPVADEALGEEYEELRRQRRSQLPPYSGINRFSWAVAQANIFLKHHEGRAKMKGRLLDLTLSESVPPPPTREADELPAAERKEEMIKPTKNLFLGWHRWHGHEVLGLFQKVSDDTWWFCGPGEGMSFAANLSQSKMVKWKEIKKQIDFDWEDSSELSEEERKRSLDIVRSIRDRIMMNQFIPMSWLSELETLIEEMGRR
jgi:hypothetical protein